ncbi:MAG: hypothetical protein R2774_10875 [Saprospiraceae bacterium]
MEKNSLIFGLVLGAITPVIGFVLVEGIFGILIKVGLTQEAASTFATERFRSMTLFAICTILIPLHIAKKYKWDETIRGMIFPILIYAGAWVYKFFEAFNIL